MKDETKRKPFVQNDGRYWYSDLRADDTGVY